jgi:predicted SnoaL-like aldol condensation-catalyzing enzyme
MLLARGRLENHTRTLISVSLSRAGIAAAAGISVILGAGHVEHFRNKGEQEAMMDPQSRKDAAIEFLRLVASGSVPEAFRKHAAPDFRHHNPYFRGDAESLMAAMEENAARNPDKVLEIQHALQDGDLVAVHSRVRMKPGDRALALAHIFRFEQNLIAELWDIGQAEPENSPNEYGMF